MAVSWSRRRDEEPDHPDHPVILAAIGVDPADPSGVAIAYVPLEPTRYAPPDELQDDVIEPTRVFKPWLHSSDWRGVQITVEYHD